MGNHRQSISPNDVRQMVYVPYDARQAVEVFLVEIVEKVRLVRLAEELSQDAFAREIGMNLGTLRNYESGRRQSISSTELQKITTHPRFKKYALWLVTGEVAPEAGQISPEIEQARIDSPLPVQGTK